MFYKSGFSYQNTFVGLEIFREKVYKAQKKSGKRERMAGSHFIP